MPESANILIVDDDEDILTAARLLLRRRFGDIVTCRRPEEVPDLLDQYDFDAVMLDMNFGPGESSGMQGLEWLGRILDIDPSMCVVMITAHGNLSTSSMRTRDTFFSTVRSMLCPEIFTPWLPRFSSIRLILLTMRSFAS